MLIGMVVVECLYKDVVGVVIGFVGLFVYLGVVLLGYFIVCIMEIWYWNGFFVVIFIVVCLFVFFLLLFLWV